MRLLTTVITSCIVISTIGNDSGQENPAKATTVVHRGGITVHEDKLQKEVYEIRMHPGGSLLFMTIFHFKKIDLKGIEVHMLSNTKKVLTVIRILSPKSIEATGVTLNVAEHNAQSFTYKYGDRDVTYNLEKGTELPKEIGKVMNGIITWSKKDPTFRFEEDRPDGKKRIWKRTENEQEKRD